jgi:ABC-2 type transport system permease protein
MLSLLKHELRSRWGAVLGWGLGLAAFGAMYTSIYPQVAEDMAGLADLQLYAAMGINVASFEGFIASSVVQFIPVLLGIYAIITSTGALAGEEEDGTLELIAAMPVARWQIVIAKAAAIGITLLLIVIVAGLLNAVALNAVKATTQVEVTLGELFVAVLNGWPITFAFAMLGLLLSAWLPTRRAASLSLAAVFIASYFGETLPGLVDGVGFLETFSLFTYFDSTATAFSDGPQAGDIVVLLAAAAVFLGLAMVAFQRRNLTVHAWPWQRPRLS